jgi:hypothetical protein
MRKLDTTYFIKEEFTPAMAGIEYPVPDMNKRIVLAKTEFINLTPHTINVLDMHEQEHIFESVGQARINMSVEDAGQIDDFKINKQVAGEITGLPDKTLGKVFIVSALVAQAAKRQDVVSPDTGPTAIRENGLIKAVKGFVTY